MLEHANNARCFWVIQQGAHMAQFNRLSQSWSSINKTKEQYGRKKGH